MATVTLSHRDPGFFQWWRRLPKEPLPEADQSLPTARVLAEGIRHRTSVSLRYQAESGQADFMLLLYPRELYRRGGYVYVEGKGYPAGKFQTLRADRILEAIPVDPPGQKARASHKPAALAKTYRRGVIRGAWGVFLDFLVIAFLISLAVQGLRWLIR